tara:strand:- start:610 stop:1053 length:444 start_codon:yes stop_codon:yes gene_type:complete
MNTYVQHYESLVAGYNDWTARNEIRNIVYQLERTKTQTEKANKFKGLSERLSDAEEFVRIAIENKEEELNTNAWNRKVQMFNEALENFNHHETLLAAAKTVYKTLHGECYKATSTKKVIALANPLNIKDTKWGKGIDGKDIEIDKAS